MLSPKRREVRLSIYPINKGILPVKEFVERSKDTKVLIRVSASGTEPPKLFPLSNSDIMPVHVPIDDGMLPDKILFFILKYVNFVKKPISEGRLPARESC